MSDIARPVPDRTGDQEAQAQHLQPTGNGPTVNDEQALLAAEFGDPDAAGFYARPDQDDTAEGGEQA
uniref:hypothetical protein n=1 Tax=Streptomyces sp. NBC_01177 TaxID=2903761 RepID=UPI002F90CC06|nr:hypothetical protein OG284_36875 [Streptomyces sp. NBC_01177]